ncbi:nicotinate-nucleotide--dimethylbenzimidazole phosphoribosyltransferase [Propionivibrio limicola]|uniref:nicotinate-nucleotide--dimethylbenzimidazole phosphoribosyltransferase n=1 Tax=Propionivibrio limicola TaxID=167645 RepID=UPI00129121E8|nr:nicotinate-nucleotide--dimethylbenzimidazole phosphoribosyltransferase [Propionivibrio limicola]
MKFSIPPLSHDLDAALQHKIDNKTKPRGSLGLLEKVALQVGRIQQTLSPAFKNPHLLIFAGDHGAAKEGISAYPQDVTWQMVENYLAGGAGANVFARQNGLALQVIDAGVAHDFGPRDGLIDAKIAPTGTRSYLSEPAMTLEECEAALRKGAKIAHGLADAGCNVMGVGEMGIGNTAAASLITHLLTGTPLIDCIGRGTGLDDAGLQRKRELLSTAVARAQLPPNADPMQVLCEFGGFEIVMMAGALLGGAERGMTLLIDGFIVTSALLAASRIAPNIRDYCIFCHRSAEPGHQAQMRDLGGEPLIDLGLRLGEGSGVVIAYPLVCSALVMLNEMASFESAGVSQSAG